MQHFLGNKDDFRFVDLLYRSIVTTYGSNCTEGHFLDVALEIVADAISKGVFSIQIVESEYASSIDYDLNEPTDFAVLAAAALLLALEEGDENCE